MYKKRIISKETPVARLHSLGHGRYAMNASEGVACTLTGAHHFVGNITHPRQGFREMGVLEIYDDGEPDNAVRPFNTEPDGTSRTIKAQYFKNNLVNFNRCGSFGATCVLVIDKK